QCPFYVILLFIHIFFLSTDTSTTDIYTLSLHDALPIYHKIIGGIKMRFTDYTINIINYLGDRNQRLSPYVLILLNEQNVYYVVRSEEHTSELQSRFDLVCRLLLEKKKKKKTDMNSSNTQ